MKNFKKLFASMAIVAMLATAVPTTVLGATGFSDELQGAYDYAYGIGITTQSSIESANMYGTLIRSHMAKMMVNYAVEVLGQTPDEWLTCAFTDVASQSDELKGYITEACQLGLMGVGITAFNPNGVVTRAQFGTVLSRALYGDIYNDGDPYYVNHLAALKVAGIMNNISNPNALEVRGYVMLMMQRADEGTTPAICETPENVLSCSLGLDTCPAECQTDVVTNGNLNVSMLSSVGGDVPYGISSLDVATYRFTASEDLRLDSVVFKRAGYFASANIPSAALFMDGGRLSKVANFSSSTDEVTLTISNGYQMKAGESIDLSVHALLLNTTNTDQFSLTLKSVSSTAANVNLDANLKSATYRIVASAAATLTLNDGATPEAPKLGETSADLFDFTLANTTTLSKQDVTLNSVTFKALWTIDENTDLANFKLVVDGVTIATAAKQIGKYLAFNIAGGYLIKEDKTPTFTVKGDVLAGAAKTIQYTLENAMDIVAKGVTNNQGVNIVWAQDMDSVTVSAGKVTVTRVNPPSTDLVGNKKDQFLGAFEITNNAGEALKLSTLQLAITGNVTKLDAVKVRLGATTASNTDLTATVWNTLWTETSLEKAIGSKLTVYVYADTIDTGMDGSTFRMSLNTASTTSFLVQESADENTVTEISPSSLTWSLMNGKDASLTLTDIALGNKTVAEGTDNVEVLRFKVKAGNAYGAKIKKLTFTAPVNSNTISSATLYEGTTPHTVTVSSGTFVSNDDLTIAAGATLELALKVNVQLNPTVTGFAFTLSSGNLEAEDTTADHNTVTVSNSITGRTITVSSAGEIVSAYESTANNNKYNKNVLAGTTETVAEYSYYSKYEAVNVGNAVVTFSAQNVDDSVLDVKLFYNGEEVASSPTWSATWSVATFNDLNFDTLTTTTPLLVKVISNVINEDGGATLAANYVDSVQLSELIGKDSGDDVATGAALVTANSKTYAIVPVTIIPSVATVGTTAADFVITAAIGTNTTSGGVAAKATLTGIVFQVEGNNGALTTIWVKDDAGTTLGSGTVGGTDGNILVALSKEVPSGATTLRITTTVSGSITNPSYGVSIYSIAYYTNVNGAWTAIAAQFGGTKSLLAR